VLVVLSAAALNVALVVGRRLRPLLRKPCFLLDYAKPPVGTEGVAGPYMGIPFGTQHPPFWPDGQQSPAETLSLGSGVGSDLQDVART
jgi:hypothetical protein